MLDNVILTQCKTGIFSALADKSMVTSWISSLHHQVINSHDIVWYVWEKQVHVLLEDKIQQWAPFECLWISPKYFENIIFKCNLFRQYHINFC